MSVAGLDGGAVGGKRRRVVAKRTMPLRKLGPQVYVMVAGSLRVGREKGRLSWHSWFDDIGEAR